MLNRRVLSLVILLPLACAKNEAPAPSEPAAAVEATTETTVTTATTASTVMTETTATAPVTAPAATGTAIATADGEAGGVTLAVKEFKRASGGTLSLKFTITNNSAKDLDVGYSFADSDNSIKDFASIGGVQLIDPVGKKKYFVARDSDGRCVCSQGLKDVKPGSSINVWAKFPAPPDDVQKISIIVPHFSPMDDVPISQ